MKSIFLQSFAASVVLLTASCFMSCDSSITTSPQDIVFPDSLISFQRNVQPLLTVTCALSGCHDAVSRVNLSTYFSLISTPGLVIAKSPNNSTLIQVFEGNLQHPPSFQAVVTANHRAGMRRWVLEGALNN